MRLFPMLGKIGWDTLRSLRENGLHPLQCFLPEIKSNPQSIHNRNCGEFLTALHDWAHCFMTSLMSEDIYRLNYRYILPSVMSLPATLQHYEGFNEWQQNAIEMLIDMDNEASSALPGRQLFYQDIDFFQCLFKIPGINAPTDLILLHLYKDLLTHYDKILNDCNLNIRNLNLSKNICSNNIIQMATILNQPGINGCMYKYIDQLCLAIQENPEMHTYMMPLYKASNILSQKEFVTRFEVEKPFNISYNGIPFPLVQHLKTEEYTYLQKKLNTFRFNDKFDSGKTTKNV